MKKFFLPALLTFAFLLSGCGVYKTIVNVSRLKFKLGQVTDASVAGINISSKYNEKDFNPMDLLKISSAFARKDIVLSFILNVEAKNPNDGTGGYPRTDLTISHLRWRLFIDDIETVTGDLDQPIQIPGKGEISNIPFRVNLDLIKFFGDRGFDSLVNLIFAIAGKKGSSANIALYVRPTVSSFLGDISYPTELKVVSKEFTN
jgi:LEA14-like dessication related protein